MIKTILYVLITIVVLAGGVYVGKYLVETAPKAERKPPEKYVPIVDVLDLKSTTYTVKLISRGTVTPRTESILTSQVSGSVLGINDNFRTGGFFEAGEELMRIDPTDYELAVTTAKSELIKMRLQLDEEVAQSKQAQSDWKKLGLAGKPDSLVMRKPQLANAKAALSAAEARVKRAEVDLQRTQIIAPYAGRVMEKEVDIGQVVSSGSKLAKIYAADYVEVRLPLTDRQLAFIDLPESYRGEEMPKEGPQVELTSKLGGKEFNWQGMVVRTDGTIDTKSRQLFVIAQVADPYQRDDSGRPPLKIGQFVQAQIKGKELTDVFVLKRSMLNGTDAVFTVDQDNKIQRRKLDIIWQEQDDVVVRSGLQIGDRVITTPLPFATEGSDVRLADDVKSGKKELIKDASLGPADKHLSENAEILKDELTIKDNRLDEKPSVNSHNKTPQVAH